MLLQFISIRNYATTVAIYVYIAPVQLLRSAAIIPFRCRLVCAAVRQAYGSTDM